MYLVVRLRRSMRSAAIAVGVAALLAVIAAHTGSAQTARGSDRPPASRLLPTDHWANEYIRLLRARGLLENLNPLVQPYTRASVAQGLLSLGPDTLVEPVGGWVRLLKDEFWSELDRLVGREPPAWGAAVAAAGRASTSRRLDPLRPLGDEGAWPWYRLGAWAEAGPIVAEARLFGDNYFAGAPNGSGEPDGLDPGQRRGGRTDHAYLGAQLSGMSLLLGRLKRNWSVPGTRGLMVSDAATSYPQVGVEAQLGPAKVTAFTGELDTILGQKRYLAAHRIDFASPRLVFSLGESVVYARPNGGPQLRYLNPVEVVFFDADNQPTDQTVNVMLDAQVWSRVGQWVVAGEALLDDIDVNPEGNERAPTRYAITLLAQWSPVTAPTGVSVRYEQVSSFAYRTSAGVDRYTFLDRGLGENYSDFDRLTFGVSYFPPIHGLRLSPLLQAQRQGEGDVRAQFPAVYNDFRRSPALFLGVTETTYRAALAGRYQPNRFVWLAWDMGENIVRNARHVAGQSVAEFSGMAELGLMVELPLRR